MTRSFYSYGLVLLSLLSIFVEGLVLGVDSTQEFTEKNELTNEPKVLVVDVLFRGLSRTDPQWIRRYVNINPPAVLTRQQALLAARRLMTTGVFSNIKVNFGTPQKSFPIHTDIEPVSLEIMVEEKWTTIPVIRGAFGGGTPLRVLGGYDTHLAGKLYTFGGEFRKYGEAPPGFVTFFRNPRYDEGTKYLGLELWNDRRIRDLFDEKRHIVGHIKTHSHKFKARYLTQPFSDSQWLLSDPTLAPPTLFQVGLESTAIRLLPTSTSLENGTGSSFEGKTYQEESETKEYLSIAPVVLLDSIESSVLELRGYKFRFHLGPAFFDTKLGYSQELEFFQYNLLPLGLNSAFHFYAKSHSMKSTATDHFLGGLDSIRGFPDGFRFGPIAYFSNLELRKIIWKSRYLWIQSLGFFDTGNAELSWEDLPMKRPLSSLGVGLRFAIPQVYRLMVRIDYAWSINDSSRGLSGGMNQFFDPAAPL